MSVPLQLILTTDSHAFPVTPSFKPYCVWLYVGFAGVVNYSTLLLWLLGRNTQETRLNPYVSMLVEVLQGATGCHIVVTTSISDLRLKPYVIRVDAGSAGFGNYSTLCHSVRSENPLLMLTLTAEQLDHLVFAIYCQVVELTEGREADEPEVQQAIQCLNSIAVTVTELLSYRQASQISGAASRPSREGLPASDFGQFAENVKPEGMRPSEKPLLILTLTAEQLKHLAFAVLCQLGELQESPEAEDPEVIAAVACLDALLGEFEALGRGRGADGVALAPHGRHSTHDMGVQS